MFCCHSDSRRETILASLSGCAAIPTVMRVTSATPPGSLVTDSIPAPTSQAQGMVRIHATRMFPATPQRTAESRVLAPAPSTAPLIVCVVETGKPWRAVNQRIAAVDV